MSKNQSIIYLLQVSLPFILLGCLKNSIFFLPVALIILALPFEALRNSLIRYWQRLGVLLSKIISPIILSVIYYMALTPLAFIKRMTSTDTLTLKRPALSNFKEVSQVNKRDDFENLW